jgi:hypothetical protein
LLLCFDSTHCATAQHDSIRDKQRRVMTNRRRAGGGARGGGGGGSSGLGRLFVGFDCAELVSAQDYKSGKEEDVILANAKAAVLNWPQVCVTSIDRIRPVRRL